MSTERANERGATAEHETRTNGSPRGTEDRPPQPGNLRLIALVVVIVLAVILAFGVLPRIHRQSQLKQTEAVQQSSGSEVSVTLPQRAPPFERITLPGNIQAVVQSAIGARSTGYVEHIFVDIGDHVKQGQVLATVSTPDVDQELAQARAQLSSSQATLAQARAGLVAQQGDLTQAQANLSRSYASLAQARQGQVQAQAQLDGAQQAVAQQRANLAQAQTNLNLASVTNTRYQNLLKQGAVDQETADQQLASFRNSQANVDALSAALQASQANVASFAAAVRSNEANVKAFADAVAASKAAVATAVANVDSSRAVVAASQANVASNQANVNHYAVLEQFNTVTAPFAGIITARNVEAGDLIGSGGGAGTAVGGSSSGVSTQGSAAGGSGAAGSSSSSAGGSLFSEAQTAVMHVYVNIPQEFAEQIAPGVHTKVAVSQLPGKLFDGIVTRTAGALDPSSRTLVTEVRVPNAKNLIAPGMFAEISFRVPTGNSGFLVDDSAIVTNSQNTQVIEITPRSTLHFQDVVVGRDFGKVSQVLSGLTGNEKLVDDPNDSMQEGQPVTMAQTPAAAKNPNGGT